MPSATQGAVASSPDGFPLDDNGEPPTFLVTELALAGDEHGDLLLETNAGVD